MSEIDKRVLRLVVIFALSQYALAGLMALVGLIVLTLN